jgi:hypothetical protein
MSMSFNGTTTTYVSMSAGGTGAMGTGAFTIAALWQTTVTSGSFANRAAIGMFDASATEIRALDVVDSPIFGTGDTSTGFGSTPAGSWVISAISKPAGAAHYRCHNWTYASDGSGTMNHGEASTAANHSDGTTITEIRIGFGDVKTNGLIAVVGLWASELTDTTLDTLKSGNLSSWAALSPQALITGNNWNGSTGCNDVVGTSSQQSITGTIGTGAEPTSFNYTLAASGINAPWLKL